MARGETVLVVGQGPIGLLLTQLARWAGAEVIASDPLAERRPWPRPSGAEAVLDARGRRAGARCAPLTGGRGADCALVAATGRAAFAQALEATRPAGVSCLRRDLAGGDRGGRPGGADHLREGHPDLLQLVHRRPGPGGAARLRARDPRARAGQPPPPGGASARGRSRWPCGPAPGTLKVVLQMHRRPGDAAVTARMKAAVLHGREDVRIEQRRHPPPRARATCSLRTKVALTCGTDAKVFRRGYHARMITPPVALRPRGGRASWRRWDRGRRAWSRGTAVVAANSAPCGECHYCRHDSPSLCDDLLFWNGAYAEFVRIPARVVAQNLVPLDGGWASARRPWSSPSPASCGGWKRARSAGASRSPSSARARSASCSWPWPACGART